MGGRWRRLRTWALLAAALAGCGGQVRRIEFYQTRPASVELPAGVRRLSVGQFAASRNAAMPWGKVAAALLEGELVEAAGSLGRYEIVRRGQAGAIRADALIGGLIEVRQSARSVVGPAGPDGPAETPAHRHFVCEVIAEFAIDGPAGQTMAAVRVSRSYDSATSRGRPAPQTEGETQGVIAELIGGCVRSFVAGLLGERTGVVETLAEGTSAAVAAGNRLAAAGKYEQALGRFLEALGEDPDDEAALFNAGLMHEALGRLGPAERCYQRARELSGAQRHLRAVQRVREHRRVRGLALR